MTPGPRTRSLLIALGLALVGQLFLVLIEPMTRASGTFAEQSGIAVLVPDSRGYLDAAERLPTESSLPWMRSGYPVLLALADLLGDAATVTVILQFMMVVVAAAALHRVLDRSAGGIAALGAAAVLVANPMTAQWVRILVTETAFYAGIVLLLALGKLMLDGRPSLPVTATYVVIGGAMPFLRANGVFVTVSAMTVLIIAHSRGRARAAAIIGLWLGLLLILPTFNATVGPPAEATLASQLRDGVVVEGTEHVRVTIPMPESTEAADESLASVVSYAVDHPFATARLGLTRVGYEVAQVRRHYPTLVNVAFGATMALYLLAAAVGLRDQNSRGWGALTVAFALPLALVTAVTFASPEGRYGWALLLPVAPVAGIGSARMVGAVVAGLRHQRA